MMQNQGEALIYFLKALLQDEKIIHQPN